MHTPSPRIHRSAGALLAASLSLAAGCQQQPDTADFEAIFDTHWQRLRDDYPFFELYGIDWERERAEHRPRALAAVDATGFSWEMARLLSVMTDAHVAYLPSPAVLKQWALPDIRTVELERRPFVIDWRQHPAPERPAALRDRPHCYPEIVAVEGTAIGVSTQVLAAGPPGTVCRVRLRWPDGSECEHPLRREQPVRHKIASKHLGADWIHSGRVGKVGYLRVRTFDPKKCTLGPAGKMTPILRRHLRGLRDTEALILDLQGNGGGLVAASDPFLRHFLERTLRYRWGNSGGRSRVLTPKAPHYSGRVVALVDERSASGGEWAARILRDAGRAVVVGGRTAGAEAAVHTSEASDGSKVTFSAWPMVEPGVEPFQRRGVTLDHALPLTIAAAQQHGYDEALQQVRRARYAKALELLGAPAEGLPELLALAAGGVR